MGRVITVLLKPFIGHISPCENLLWPLCAVGVQHQPGSRRKDDGVATKCIFVCDVLLLQSLSWPEEKALRTAPEYKQTNLV